MTLIFDPSKEKEKKLKNYEIEEELILNLPSFNIQIHNVVETYCVEYLCPNFSCDKYLDFVVLDVETTGLSIRKDHIVEIGAIRFLNGHPVEKFHVYVNPEVAISEEITNINNVTNKMVFGQPTISEVISSFDDFIKNSSLIGHNLDFDLKFLHYSGSKVLSQNNCFIDTLSISHLLLKAPKKDVGYHWDDSIQYDVLDYKLKTLCDYYQIPLDRNHNALFDAYATGRLYLALLGQLVK